MGQNNQPMVNKMAIKNELKLVDEKQALYFNVCNQKYYTKLDLYLQDVADMEYELEVFKFRRINENLVVSVDYCSKILSSEICFSVANFSYFIQKLETVLFQKTTIKIEEGIKLITHVLRGFQVLYGQFGYFTPSSRMIWVSKMNEVKVWVNQDFRITKNTQYPHCPRSMVLQNKLIRQIILLFDCLRDPFQPLFRFSQNLPSQLLTFQAAIDIYAKRLQQLQTKRQSNILRQLQNKPMVKQIDRLIPTNIVSAQVSPMSSPFKIAPRIIIQSRSPERQHLKKSFHPQITPQPNLQEFKEAVSTSLKNTANVSSLVQQMNVSKQATSTMPVSPRNSRVHNRNFTAQTPSLQKLKGTEPKGEENQAIVLKKQVTQRSSQAEPTSFGNNISPQPIILEQESAVKIDNISKQSFDQTSKSKKIIFESILNSIPSKVQYQSHKRHRTDLKITEFKSQINSNLNQKSAIQGTLINNFNVNTIKSIHLLEQDRDIDTEIVVDLKHLINKYRQKR